MVQCSQIDDATLSPYDAMRWGRTETSLGAGDLFTLIKIAMLFSKPFKMPEICLFSKIDID